MCIMCLCKSVQEKIEENYILNREEIIIEFYDFFQSNPDEKVNQVQCVSKEDEQKFQNIWSKIKKIQQMVENGADENEVLSTLQIVSAEMELLTRHDDNLQKLRDISNGRISIH